MDMTYIKWVHFTMTLVGAWPSKEMGYVPGRWEHHLRWFSVVYNIITLVLQILFIKNNIGKISFYEMGHSYITGFMNAVALSRALLIFQKKYHEISSEFFEKVHLFNLRNDSEYSMQIHILVHKISHFFTMCIHVQMIFGIIMFNATPLHQNIINGAFTGNASFEHSVYLQWPFDYITDLKGYIAVFIINVYLSITCSTFFCCYDLFVSLLVFHVWGHLKIFIHNLENFPRPKGSWYTEEESKQVLMKLKALINHHRLILNFMSKISNTFGLMLFVYYGFHQICGCILLLECSTLEPNAIIRYGPLTAIVFQELIQVSLIFELLGSMTDSVIKAVYNLPWELMETPYRRIVHVMMIQSQLPLSTRALDMVDVGSRTMVAILKTSLSYFVMLHTFATTEE